MSVRNSPCCCGSGKKFKECCRRLHHVEPKTFPQVKTGTESVDAVRSVLRSMLDEVTGSTHKQRQEIWVKIRGSEESVLVGRWVSDEAGLGLGWIEVAEAFKDDLVIVQYLKRYEELSIRALNLLLYGDSVESPPMGILGESPLKSLAGG